MNQTTELMKIIKQLENEYFRLGFARANDPYTDKHEDKINKLHNQLDIITRAEPKSDHFVQENEKVSEELVERVARAICKIEGYDPDEDSTYCKASGVQLDIALSPEMKLRWRTYIRQAKAAIAAYEAAMRGEKC